MRHRFSKKHPLRRYEKFIAWDYWITGEVIKCHQHCKTNKKRKLSRESNLRPIIAVRRDTARRGAPIPLPLLPNLWFISRHTLHLFSCIAYIRLFTVTFLKCLSYKWFIYLQVLFFKVYFPLLKKHVLNSTFCFYFHRTCW